MARPSGNHLPLQAISRECQGLQGTTLAARGPCTTQPQMEDLNKLDYGNHEEKINVRIIRIWHSFSSTTYYESSTNFILLDAKNNQIWATADRVEGDRLEGLICRGLLYFITNFKIIPATGPFKPIDTTKTIVFGRTTVIQDCLHGSSVPPFAFNLRSWPEIVSRLNKITTLTDAGGIIIDAGDIEYKRNDITRVAVTLINSSLAEIHVSLWGKIANLFRIELAMHRKKNVVLIVTGLLVKINKGKIILSSTPATDLLFDPNCEGTSHLSQQITETYGDFICQVPERAKYPYQLLRDKDKCEPYSTIQELKHTRLWIYQKFRCKAIILDILIRGGRHDGSCIRCKNRVCAEGSNYYCAKCGRNYITPISRSSFMLLVVDRTGNTKFTLQARELQQLTGRSRDDLLSRGKLLHGIPTFPTALQIIKGAQCTFQAEAQDKC
ncbi:hypothetical protein POM88_054478 [Heracleum sosnowskyi]|uniref:Replication protein A 70 kDa DNA-binding subunit B/D first OB fold domain-containing protein n=1 Tax=Heracleum sosnowskyi TaxID=360622 RepID=A0AAD8GNI2_9APIA|nr:hypothetical protein POM88_054478 [Heracleum sosnowskyi]